VNGLRTQRRKYKRWRKEVHAGREVIAAAKSSQTYLSANPQIFIGPTNSAGQGTSWARALTQSGVQAQSMRIVNSKEEFFTADLSLARLDWTKFATRLNLAKQIGTEFSGVLLESIRPIFALKVDNSFTAINAIADLKLLIRDKKKVAVVFHGSDIRDMEYHASVNPFSPYRSAGQDAELVRVRAEQARSVLPALRRAKIPIFITTPDLFHEVPDAIWLPLTINLPPYFKVADEAPAFAHSGAPRVLYLPSKSWVKSAEIIEPILNMLDEEGVINWVRSERVSNEALPELLRTCDVLVDQFVGIVGALPLEAMAAGRLVLTHLEGWAYEKIAKPPVLEVTPTTLEKVLRELKVDNEQIAAGRDYVRKWHDGTVSSNLLRDKLLAKK